MRIVRARRIPKILFHDIVSFFEEIDIHKVQTNFGIEFKIAFLKKEQAVIGFTEYREPKVGIFSSFRAWNFDFKPSFKPDDFYKNLLFDMPHFQIKAGPFCQQEWDPQKGYKIIETTKVLYNNFEFFFNNPFFIFIDSVMGVVELIKRDYKIRECEYWQTYMNPEADYSDKQNTVF